MKTKGKAPRAKPWYRRWWAWCLWVLLTLLLCLVVLGIWVWSSRYELMESRAIDMFAEAGIEADLDIASVSKTQTLFQDIRLRQNGEEFLRIDRLQADYVWPDIRDGQIKHIDVKGAALRLTLGEDWRPADQWLKDLMPERSGETEASKAGFPLEGVRLSNTTLILASPLGETALSIDADIESETAFKSEIILALSDLSYEDYSAQGGGLITLERSGSDLLVKGQLQTEALAHSQFTMKDADFSLEGQVNLETKSYDGNVVIENSAIISDNFTMDASSLNWDGRVNLESKALSGRLAVTGQSIESGLVAADDVRLTWDGDVSNLDHKHAKGLWSIETSNARIPNPDRANELAETLSLYPALNVVPVTEHYALDLKQSVKQFFLGSDVQGAGKIDLNEDGFTISPDGVIHIESAQNKLSLSPRDSRRFYSFDAPSQSINAQMDAKFKKPVGLSLTDIQLQAASEDGVRLGGVDRFTAKLATQETWNAIDANGRPVRLAPLHAALEFEAGTSPRRLRVETALDYDGDLPGGRVTGLNLDGRLDVHLYETRQELDFTPKEGSQISLDVLETPTNWVGEDIRFILPPTEKLFIRGADRSNIMARLEQADFTFTQAATLEAEAQRLDVQSDNVMLEGVLYPDQTQDWAVEFQGAEYASETLPGPGTTARAQHASLTASLAPEQAAQITFKSPSITAQTPAAGLSNFAIALEGTPDAYRVSYSDGTVDVLGSEFAKTAEAAGLGSFPADGRVEFIDGGYRGQANLVVAKANDADVAVSYEYANGEGAAEIDIPSILFEPKGLQPQTLVPAFRGKIAEVEGEARVKVNIRFADGALTESNGSVQLVDMDIGTAPGPITGLNTMMRFSSLLPLKTEGIQRLTMDSFNPGMPLENGVMTFSLVPEGVSVESADWPIGNGFFSLDPFTWIYDAEENRVTMRIKNVSLGDFLNDFGNSKVTATGNVVGEFPIVVRGVEVLVEDGTVYVPDGGVINYDPGPSVPFYSEADAIDVLRKRRSGEYALLAQDALREFRYRELSASMDGPIGGDIEIGLVFDGSNAKVLNRQPFRFDITVRGELINIARSFNSNAQVKSQILRENGQLPDGAVIGN